MSNSFSSPFENLAFEESYFQTFSEETLRLWRNPDSVVVGKHQNAMAESNFPFCRENNIPIIRRVSGGGTVFHDIGNINFSFYRFVNASSQVNYRTNLDIMVDLLRTIGYDVDVNERHDLTLNGFKISGNAQHVRKGRALHHGTILYDTNTERLNQAIKRKTGQFVDKAVKSVRSNVINLRTAHDNGISQNFFDMLVNSAKDKFDFIQSEHQIDPDILKKYSTDEWNFGYGPMYTFQNQENGHNLEMQVDRGSKISSIKLSDKHMNAKLQQLLGAMHHFESISNRISKSDSLSVDKEFLLKILF
jgi:lipoate---protein ligase